jgi:hypothetical protein
LKYRYSTPHAVIRHNGRQGKVVSKAFSYSHDIRQRIRWVVGLVLIGKGPETGSAVNIAIRYWIHILIMLDSKRIVFVVGL